MGDPPGLAGLAAVPMDDLTVSELGLLIKFFAAMPELPRIDAGDPHSRGERVQLWRASIEGTLSATWPVVTEWWHWSWGLADAVYRRWLTLPPMERTRLKVQDPVPNRF